MRLTATLVLAATALLAVAAFGDARATHTGFVRSARIEVRFRPESWAGATAERVLAAAERDLDRIAKDLEVTFKQAAPIGVFVYDDVAELLAITGTSANSGHSTGTEVHVPYANDQTRLHELVHVVARALPRPPVGEPRNAFFDEGLANAVLEFVDGVHVHSVAAFYLSRDKLPALSQFATGDFYGWQAANPKFDAYDVAASWMRFLLDRFGAQRVKLYYVGASAKFAFGTDEAELEKTWREYLAKVPLRPETLTLLRYRAGEPVGFEPYVKGLPFDIAGRASEWTALNAEKLKLMDLGKWNREDGVITGMNPTADWTTCEFGTETYGDCVVRARIKTSAYCALRVQIGSRNQAILVGSGTYVFRGETAVAQSNAATMHPMRRETDLVLVRRGEELQVWVDGVKVLTTAAVPGLAVIGIGVAQGSATFHEVRVRKFPER